MFEVFWCRRDDQSPDFQMGVVRLKSRISCVFRLWRVVVDGRDFLGVHRRTGSWMKDRGCILSVAGGWLDRPTG